MNIESELKPCPFCGQHARIFISESFFQRFIVRCGNSVCPKQPTVETNSLEGAIALWNTRPIEDDLNEQIGRFKKYAEALENEIKELREALTFYAKGEHLGLEDWQTEQILKDDDVFAESYVETGKRAREALKAGKDA